ncbi:MAG: hypothetical protein LBS62_05855 [Clostridiales bacterium]|nr:hypothetical protein [Clostridiales bacterium]
MSERMYRNEMQIGGIILTVLLCWALAIGISGIAYAGIWSDEWNNLVYSAKGSRPVSYDKG